MNTHPISHTHRLQGSLPPLQSPQAQSSAGQHSWWSSLGDLFQSLMGSSAPSQQPSAQAPPLQERAAPASEGSWLTQLITRLFASLAERICGFVSGLFSNLAQELDEDPEHPIADPQHRVDPFEQMRRRTREYTHQMGSSLGEAARQLVTDLGATVAQAAAPYRPVIENEIVQEVPPLLRGAARFALNRFGGSAAPAAPRAESVASPANPSPAVVAQQMPAPPAAAVLQPAAAAEQPLNPSALEQAAGNLHGIRSGAQQVAAAASGLRDQVVRGWGALRQGFCSLFQRNATGQTA